MEEYCSHEVAILLKNLGFNTRCTWYCRELNKSDHRYDRSNKPIGYGVYYNRINFTLVPTQKMAIDWVKRYHNVSIELKNVCKNLKMYHYCEATGKDGYFVIDKQHHATKIAAINIILKQVLRDLLREKKFNKSKNSHGKNRTS